MKEQYFKLHRTGEICKRVYAEDGVTFFNEPNLELQMGDILIEIEPPLTTKVIE